MTLSEFKAWFEGFTENMEGPPSAKQFKKLKAKVAEIDGTGINVPFYIERYYPPIWEKPYVWSDTTYVGSDTTCVSNNVVQAVSMHSLGQYDAVN